MTPRVAACMIAGPFLNVLCFTMGAAGLTLVAMWRRCYSLMFTHALLLYRSPCKRR